MASARINITAQNNMSKGIKSAEKDLKGFQETAKEVGESAEKDFKDLEKTTSKFGESLKKAFAFTAIVASVKKIATSCISMTKEFESANRKYKQLQITLGNTKDYDKVVSTIGRLSRQTLEGKDAVESMASQLAGLGKTSEEIDKISEASVYLSNVTGKSLDTSMEALLNTMQGSAGELAKYGIGVENLTKEELTNGKALDLVIEKMGSLSDEMSKDSLSQYSKNIKDTFGDIQQGIGQVFSVLATPIAKAIDEGLLAFQEGFQSSVDDVTIMIKNLPLVFEKFVELIRAMTNKLFDYENLKAIFIAFLQGILLSVKTALERIANMISLISGVVESLMDGIRNYVMGIIIGICNDIGINISGIINKIGEWLVNSPIGKVVDQIISTIVNGIRLTGALIKNIPSMVKIIASSINTIVENIFLDIQNGFWGGLSSATQGLKRFVDNIVQSFANIGTDLRNVFGWIVAAFKSIGSTGKDVFRYIGDVIKATFSWEMIKTNALGMIDTFCNFFIDALNGIIDKAIGWMSKLGIEVKKINRSNLSGQEGMVNPYANIKGIQTYGVDFEKESYKTVTSSFSKLLDNLDDWFIERMPENESNWTSISKQFANLLNPVFEKYSTESATTVGQTLATWTSKSSKEYFEQSKKSFASIGEFLDDWGSTFLDDEKENFNAFKDVVTTVGESIFGDDIKGFSEFVDKLLAEGKAQGLIGTSGKPTAIPTVGGTQGTVSNEVTETVKAVFPDNNKGIWNWFENSIQTPLTDEFNKLAEYFDMFGESIPNWLSAVGNEFMSGVMEWVGALQPLFDVVNNAINPMKMILHVIEGFVNILEPALTAVFQPLVDVFTDIGETIGMLFIPIMDVLGGIIAQISSILGSVLLPIIQLLTPLFDLLAMALQPLNGLLGLFGKAIIAIMSPIQWLADLFSWLGEWIRYFGKCIGEVINHIFDMWNADFSGKPGSFTSDAFNLGDKFANFDSLANGAPASMAVSAQQAVQNASYQGSSNVTLNIYIEGGVYGDGGIETLAKQIRAEFLELDRYGI